MGEAHAIIVADDILYAIIVSLIGAQLIASGVKFANQIDMRAAASAIADYVQNDDPRTWSLLKHFAYANVAAIDQGSKAVVRWSQDLWDKVTGKHKDAVFSFPGLIPQSYFIKWDEIFTPFYNDYKYMVVYNDFGNGSTIYGTSVVPFLYLDYPKAPELSCFFNDYKLAYRNFDKSGGTSNIFHFGDNPYYADSRSSVFTYYFSKPVNNPNGSCYAWDFTAPIYGGTSMGADKDKLLGYLWPNPTGASADSITAFIHDTPYSTDGKIDVTGICTLPDNIAHTILMPDMPYMQDGEIVYPDIPLEPADNLANVADLPGYTDTADVPYDLPIDTTTGKVLNPDLPDVPDVPDVPEVGLSDILAAIEAATAAVGSITDALTKPLDLPDIKGLSLPALITTKFPFCIPFDAARLVALLDAEPVAPRFEIPLKVFTFEHTIVITFERFEPVLEVIRWFEYIVFVAGLMVATRNFIKW